MPCPPGNDLSLKPAWGSSPKGTTYYPAHSQQPPSGPRAKKATHPPSFLRRFKWTHDRLTGPEPSEKPAFQWRRTCSRERQWVWMVWQVPRSIIRNTVTGSRNSKEKWAGRLIILMPSVKDTRKGEGRSSATLTIHCDDGYRAVCSQPPQGHFNSPSSSSPRWHCRKESFRNFGSWKNQIVRICRHLSRLVGLEHI